jgi:type IV pilus assembly protein PilV
MLVRSKLARSKTQNGVMLIEALIGMLIFSIGILAIIMMQAQAISAQSDAQYRTEAANFANQLASAIWLNTIRDNGTVNAASLANFNHQTTTGGWCTFSGAPSSNAMVTAWATRVTQSGSGLPGAQSDMISVTTDTSATGYNKVTIQICWKAPNDTKARRHSLVTHIN